MTNHGRRGMNGWQRLWIFLGVFWLILAGMLGYDGMWVYDFQQGKEVIEWTRGVERFAILIGFWLSLYPIGKGVGWVFRGFRKANSTD